MTHEEEELYKIVKAISFSDVPIMFKGAIITKIVLSEKHYTETERDIVCENITGKSVTEFTSDAILDNLPKAAKKATGAATTAKNAVSSWFSKVSNPVSTSNVQYSGA